MLKKYSKIFTYDGISEKIYRKLIEQVLLKLPTIDEWYDKKFIVAII